MPAHLEQTPSCYVYEDHVHCYACGFHQDAIGVIRQIQGCDFWSAVSWLAQQAGIPGPHRDPEAQKRYEAVLSLSETYAEIFHDSLKNALPALQYLEGRGSPRRQLQVKSVAYLLTINPRIRKPRSGPGSTPNKETSFFPDAS